MIVIDSSAVVAVILAEPEAGVFMSAMARSRGAISAMNVFESEVVIMSRKGAVHAREVRNLLTFHGVEIVPFDDAQAAAAFATYARFGKGHHPAKLNLCDCAAYALAKSLDAPLLYKGGDFGLTDVTSAVTPG